MPDRMPEGMSDRMSGYMPERMSDRMSEYIYIYFQTVCQKLYQNCVSGWGSLEVKYVFSWQISVQLGILALANRYTMLQARLLLRSCHDFEWLTQHLIPIRPILLCGGSLDEFGNSVRRAGLECLSMSLSTPRSFGVKLWRVLVPGAGQASGCMRCMATSCKKRGRTDW